MDVLKINQDCVTNLEDTTLIEDLNEKQFSDFCDEKLADCLSGDSNWGKSDQLDIQSTESTKILVEELNKNLSHKNFFGFKRVDKNFVGNVLKITTDNYEKILKDYEDKYGKYLYNEISEAKGLNNATKLELLLHLEKMKSIVSDDKISYKTLNILEKCTMTRKSTKKADLNNLFSKLSEIKHAIESPDVIAYLLRIAINQNNTDIIGQLFSYIEQLGDMSRILIVYPQKKVLFWDYDKLPKNVSFHIDYYSKIARLCCNNYKTMFEDIYKMDIPDEIKKKMIKFIIIMLEKSNRQHFAKDMKEHIDDPKKLNIDYLRLLSSTTHLKTNVFYDEKKVINDTISPNMCQDGSNCWQVASIIALACKEAGQEKLKELYKIDRENKTITVHLKEPDKDYTYTFDEIVQMQGMLDGDMPAKAIGMAMDEYFKENAYQKNNIEYDLTGNSSSRFYKVAFGESAHSILPIFVNSSDINKSDRYYTYEFITSDMGIHVICLTRADDKYVYYRDPSAVKCTEQKMTWQKFRKKIAVCKYIKI